MDPIAVVGVRDRQRGRDDRQAGPVLSPQQGFRCPPGDEGVTRIEHKLKERPESLGHVSESRQAVTGIGPVPVVVTSPELAECHDSGMPQPLVHLFGTPPMNRLGWYRSRRPAAMRGAVGRLAAELRGVATRSVAAIVPTVIAPEGGRHLRFRPRSPTQ
ncbi:hypothetical protein [Streptomyces sp. NPDC005180]|uniref:hypothetical protein n=1 Tax=Streptomyces sp. NPDC005180 TaxID=3156868 RepID=UPI0033B5B906